MSDKVFAGIIEVAAMISLKTGCPVVLNEDFELDGIRYQCKRTVMPDGFQRFNIPQFNGGGGSLVLQFKNDDAGCGCMPEEGLFCDGSGAMISDSLCEDLMEEYGAKYDPTLRF